LAAEGERVMNGAEINVLSAANFCAAHYGDDAADFARRCAAAMLMASNVDDWIAWSQVIRLIEGLQRGRVADRGVWRC